MAVYIVIHADVRNMSAQLYVYSQSAVISTLDGVRGSCLNSVFTTWKRHRQKWRRSTIKAREATVDFRRADMTASPRHYMLGLV